MAHHPSNSDLLELRGKLEWGFFEDAEARERDQLVQGLDVALRLTGQHEHERRVRRAQHRAALSFAYAHDL